MWILTLVLVFLEALENICPNFYKFDEIFSGQPNVDPPFLSASRGGSRSVSRGGSQPASMSSSLGLWPEEGEEDEIMGEEEKDEVADEEKDDEDKEIDDENEEDKDKNSCITVVPKM